MKPEELIKKAVRKPTATWFDKLDSKQKAYVHEVVDLMKAPDSPPMQTVARLLQHELCLDVSLQQMVKTLKDKMNG